jgi:TctA family transporter
MILMPAILVFCVIGACGDNSVFFNVWIMPGAGVKG